MYAIESPDIPNEDSSTFGIRFCVRAPSSFSFPDPYVADPIKNENCPRYGDYYYVRMDTIVKTNSTNTEERTFINFESRE